jgi:thiosulfate/3-mercaptopyruvate sulfurtransferase
MFPSRSLLAALVALPVVVAGQPLAPAKGDPRAAILVSTTWLAGHLKDPNLVLLHVGDPKEYGAKHIAGARFVSMNDVSVSDHSGKGLMLEMPAPDTLRAHLAALGISEKSRIVVYYGNDWVSPATRIFMTLNFAGLGDNTSLLDGGMGQWVKDGQPVTADVPAPKAGTLAPLKLRNFVVNADYVKSQIGQRGVSIVDGRNSVYYDGVEAGGGMGVTHRKGHIAGAKSVPFNTITDESLHLLPAKELAALFAAAGVGPDDVVIGYCHIGQQTTAMLFAARSLGHPILLYDGSFEDWSRHTDFPVENPSAKGKP